MEREISGPSGLNCDNNSNGDGNNNNIINSIVNCNDCDGNGESESEKEKYFVVEFSGLIDRLAMKDKLTSAKFIGIETDEPMLQIDNCFFRGEYQLTLGTHVIFDQKDLNFVAKTDKKLVMKRVFLN